jgi:GntR family transcriptional regulator, transcriptional repressor for pyruvate dehydrogenase complex
MERDSPAAARWGAALCLSAMADGSPDDRNTHVFPSVERDSSLSDKVAKLITESILAGDVRPGERLPPERDLMGQFGVSRTVIREAVRSLAAKGLVRQQARAGHVVSELSPDTVAESMTLYLRGRGPYGLEKLMEVRATIETQTAGLAAERASDAEIEQIRAVNAELVKARGAHQTALADIAFHRAIAHASGNEFFVMMLDSIRGALLQAESPGLAHRETVDYVRNAHSAILESIDRRDREGARAAMQAHIEESARRLKPLHVEAADAS